MKTIHVKKLNIYFGLLYLALFIPLLNLDITNMIFNGQIKLVVLLIIILFHTVWHKKYFVVTKIITAAYLVILISTLLNHGSLRDVLGVMVPPVAMLLLFDTGVQVNSSVFYKITTWTLVCLVWMNFLTLVVFPNGLYSLDGISPYWLLGLKNVHVRYIVPAIALQSVFHVRRLGKLQLSDYLLMLAGVVSCFLSESSTGIVGVLGFCAFILGSFILKKFHAVVKSFVFNPKVIFGIIVFVYVMVLQGNDSFLSKIVKEYLGKDMTFTGRTYIWAKCLQLSAAKPLLGYGYLNSEKFYSLINVGLGAHPHDYVVGWIFFGGILALAVIASAYLYLLHIFVPSRNVSSYIFMWATLSFLVMGITDIALLSVLFHPMMLLCESALREEKEKKWKLSQPDILEPDLPQ